MKKEKILIFGNSPFARHICYQIQNFSEFEVEAFVVDDEYKTTDKFCDKPLLGLSEIGQNYNCSEYKFFVAIGYSKMNKLREEKFNYLKNLGYDFINFIHPSAIIAPNVKLGKNCIILENTVLQPFVQIEDNTFIWASTTICHDCVIGKNVFIASNVCINGEVIIENNCFIGASATIRNGITLKDSCLIGAGCTVLENIEANAVLKSKNYEKLTMQSIDITGI